MSEAREKYYMEMNDEFTVVDKITAGNYSDELEQQKAELFSNLCMAMNNDKRKLYKEEILKTIEKYK